MGFSCDCDSDWFLSDEKKDVPAKAKCTCIECSEKIKVSETVTIERWSQGGFEVLIVEPSSVFDVAGDYSYDEYIEVYIEPQNPWVDFGLLDMSDIQEMNEYGKIFLDDQEIYHLCEKCSDLKSSYIELGYCVTVGQLLSDHRDMVELAKG